MFRSRSQESTNFKKYLNLIKGKDNSEQRKIEMALLKPKPISVYKGPQSGQLDVKSKSLVIMFPNKNIITRLGRFIKIHTYQNNNTYDTNIFTELLNLLEKGVLTWKSGKGFYYKDRRIRALSRRKVDVN